MLPVRSNANTPKSLPIVTPDRPSAPPVIDGSLVRRLEQHEADAERHHQAREIRAAHDEEARREADERAGRAGDDEAAERLAPAVHGEQPRRVRADAEEGRVTERDDAGVAEDEVERHARTAR